MKDIKADDRFERAADALVDTWFAGDAGDHTDEAEKLYRAMAKQLAADYGRSLGDVMNMIIMHAGDAYKELV